VEPAWSDVRRRDPAQALFDPHALVHHWGWHLDEVYVKNHGEMHYPGAAIDTKVKRWVGKKILFCQQGSGQVEAGQRQAAP